MKIYIQLVQLYLSIKDAFVYLARFQTVTPWPFFFDGLDINCAKTWRRTVQVTSDKATVLMVDNYHFELVGCPGKVMIFPISFSGVVLAQFLCACDKSTVSLFGKL